MPASEVSYTGSLNSATANATAMLAARLFGEGHTYCGTGGGGGGDFQLEIIGDSVPSLSGSSRPSTSSSRPRSAAMSRPREVATPRRPMSARPGLGSGRGSVASSGGAAVPPAGGFLEVAGRPPSPPSPPSVRSRPKSAGAAYGRRTPLPASVVPSQDPEAFQRLCEMIGQKATLRHKTVNQCFRHVDTNEGWIEKDELRRFLRGLNVQQEQADQFFEGLDSRGCGEVDFHVVKRIIAPYIQNDYTVEDDALGRHEPSPRRPCEIRNLVEVLGWRANQKYKQAREAFRCLDRDKDGRITREEIHKFVEQFGYNRLTADRAFEMLCPDNGKSNFIDYQLFMETLGDFVTPGFAPRRPSSARVSRPGSAVLSARSNPSEASAGALRRPQSARPLSGGGVGGLLAAKQWGGSGCSSASDQQSTQTGSDASSAASAASSGHNYLAKPGKPSGRNVLRVETPMGSVPDADDPAPSFAPPSDYIVVVPRQPNGPKPAGHRGRRGARHEGAEPAVPPPPHGGVPTAIISKALSAHQKRLFRETRARKYGLPKSPGRGIVISHGLHAHSHSHCVGGGASAAQAIARRQRGGAYAASGASDAGGRGTVPSYFTGIRETENVQMLCNTLAEGWSVL